MQAPFVFLLTLGVKLHTLWMLILCFSIHYIYLYEMDKGVLEQCR